MLRGIAAFAVAAIHLPDRSILRYLPGSYLAVDFFFALSGFVISHAYLARLKAGLSGWHFLALRWTRLYPIYALGLLIGCMPILFHDVVTLRHGFTVGLGLALALNATMLPVPADIAANSPYFFPFNAPAWSLFWELSINIFFAIVTLKFQRSMIFTVIGLAFAALIGVATAYGSLNAGSYHGTFGAGAARVIFSFFAGVVVYRFWTAKPTLVKVPFWVPPIALMVVFAVSASGIRRGVFDILTVSIVFPLIILAAAGTEPTRRWANACSVAGNASYPFYMLHVPLIAFFSWTVVHILHRSPATIGAVGVTSLLATVVIVSLVTERYFDRPLRSAASEYFGIPKG